MINGSIHFAQDFVVDNNFSTKDLVKIKNKYSIELLVSNGSFELFKTMPLEFNGKKIIATIFFEKGLIARVSIYLLTNKSGWDENSCEEHKKNKIKQDGWLKQLLHASPPYIYSWGTIESVFDQRACSSNIIINYK